MATVAGPSIIGPSLHSDTSSTISTKKHRQKKERRDEMAEDSDASASSSTSRQEKKERKRREKEERRERRRSRSADTSMTSASETEGEGSQSLGQKLNNPLIPKTAKELARMKGKGPAESAFKMVHPEITLCIPPILMHDAHRAANEQLDSLLMRYVPQFGGVLMSYSDLKFMQKLGKIDGDGAFANVLVGVSGLIWAPKIGTRLEGKIKLSTPSHVSLLVHGIFNASITSAHLPSVQEMAHMPKETGFEWQEFPEEEEEEEDVAMQEPAEIKSEEQAEGEAIIETEKASKRESDAAEHEFSASGDKIGEKSTGCWIEKKTGKKLGGESGTVVFTVVGITIANHMISIHGSLLRKPFSIPAPTYVPNASFLSSQGQGNSDVTNQKQAESRRVRFGGHQTSEFAPYEDSDSDEDSDIEEPHFSSANVSQNNIIESTSGKGSKKKRSKVGPKREGETSESESEAEAGREKKKRRKSSK